MVNKTIVATLIFCYVYQFGFTQEYEMLSNGRLILGTYKERTASVAIGDIDGDGDIDIIIANGRHWPGQNRIFINDGRGIFTVEKNLGNQRSTSYAAELADFDNDGDLDIAVGNDMAPNYIYKNDGKGNFSRSSSFGIEYAPTRNLTLADIDQDGDIDILSAAPGDDTIAWHENLGAGITSTEELEDKLTPPIAFNNFPNPFQSKTTIEFRVSEPGQVTLDVSDIQGRVFARLIDRYMNPGIHRVEFDGSGLAPGLYFTRLRRGEVQVVRKMVRVK